MVTYLTHILKADQQKNMRKLGYKLYVCIFIHMYVGTCVYLRKNVATKLFAISMSSIMYIRKNWTATTFKKTVATTQNKTTQQH